MIDETAGFWQVCWQLGMARGAWLFESKDEAEETASALASAGFRAMVLYLTSAAPERST